MEEGCGCRRTGGGGGLLGQREDAGEGAVLARPPNRLVVTQRFIVVLSLARPPVPALQFKIKVEKIEAFLSFRRDAESLIEDSAACF